MMEKAHPKLANLKGLLVFLFSALPSRFRWGRGLLPVTAGVMPGGNRSVPADIWGQSCPPPAAKMLLKSETGG